MSLISFENTILETEEIVPDVRLGGQPAKGHPAMLNFRNYVKTVADVPAAYNFFKGKKAFPVYDTGNNEYGCCTRAKQAIMQMVMERIEQKKTKIITREEILRVYMEMSARLYGGGDNGAYEIDALNSWRRPEHTFKDDKGRPMTIDGFVKINHSDPQEVKKALVMSGSKSIALCLGLPAAWASQHNMVWDIPEGQGVYGRWGVGSWGFHSMTAIANYDEWGVVLPSTWNVPNGKISWRAFATYCSEAYVCIDSVNQWKQRKEAAGFNLKALVSDINNVSYLKIK